MTNVCFMFIVQFPGRISLKFDLTHGVEEMGHLTIIPAQVQVRVQVQVQVQYICNIVNESKF